MHTVGARTPKADPAATLMAESGGGGRQRAVLALGRQRVEPFRPSSASFKTCPDRRSFAVRNSALGAWAYCVRALTPA